MNQQLPQPRKPKYRFYATLLDSFQWYLSSEAEDAMQEMLNKLNRVPFISEAAEKGTAFNEVVDMVIKGEAVIKDERNYIHKGFGFDINLVNEFASNLSGAISQVHVSAFIETVYGLVEVYGYIDELMPALVSVDIKTTGNYTFPKYLHNWQHIVYPYCLHQKTGFEYTFAYMVTDFKNTYVESYDYRHERDAVKLKGFCEQLIGFIEMNRDKITDEKLFKEPEAIAA